MLLFGENVLWLLVLIGVMIMIHELGHFWAARYFDVKVEAFSFGFGPRLFGFRRGDTDYRFSLIMLGGYVKMAGEQPSDENHDDPRGFLAKPRWQRLIIAFAGPLMNVVLAVALLTGLYMFKFQKVAHALTRANTFGGFHLRMTLVIRQAGRSLKSEEPRGCPVSVESAPFKAGLCDSGEEFLAVPLDLNACLNSHGLYDPLRFVLRLSPEVHRKIEALQVAYAAGKVDFEGLRAHSTYVHETIHWWQHAGSTIGLMLS